MDKRFICVLLATIVLSMFTFTGCKGISDGIPNAPKTNNTENKATADTSDAYRLSFKETISINKLKELDGKKVTINGYLATSSPADGTFIFLMNLPYQNCPFCVPNTSQLMNTLEVYPKENEKFEFTTQAVTVTGIMRVAEDGKSFTDNFGYEFNYKVTDAEYHIMTESDMTDKMKTYQTIADSGIINELYNMYDYMYFVTNWTEYCQQAFTDIDGTEVPGYWFYPGDFQNYLMQFYSFMSDTYFDDLIKKIEPLNTDKSFDKIIQSIKDCKTLNDKVQTAFNNQEWTTEERYWEEIQNTEIKYTYNNAVEFNTEYDRLWNIFCEFINSYEL